MPIKVGFFQCTNCAPIICYPKLYSTSNPDSGSGLWDGRNVSGSTYKLLVNQSVIVNLKATGIAPGTVFLIGEDTVAGVDRYASAPEFEYDPNSTAMVCGSRWGAIYHGSFTWDGTKDTGGVPFSIQSTLTAAQADTNHLAAAYLHEAMRQFGRPDDAMEGAPCQELPETRVVPWADGSDLATINRGIASIIGRLVTQGYYYDYETKMEENGKATTTFTIGLKEDPILKLAEDWQSALIISHVAAAGRKSAFEVLDDKANISGVEKAGTPPAIDNATAA
ncbi:hypothetical protein BKA70DRAFT_1393970 [Coprinopsis sp. MPI-PUGE-AT-0042]|nr:hypothetical protein BKA70DRAFT_1393970 [Coprinopsis sp. MPI-PUGE-AT-0042]